MAWEEAFGIQIADDEAGKLRTPRMVIDLIQAKLGGTLRGDGTCLTQRGFYRLRRAFLPLATVPRQAVTPKARLADMIPQRGRKKLWREFQSAVDFATLPALNRPAWCHWALAGVTLGVFVFSLLWLCPALASFRDPSLIVLGAGFALAGFACWLGFRITRPLRTEFPLETFGDLTRCVVADSLLKIREPDRLWSREDVAVVVREIITQQLGVKEFSDDADFIRDLGVD